MLPVLMAELILINEVLTFVLKNRLINCFFVCFFFWYGCSICQKKVKLNLLWLKIA